ncbi:hypothetical protein [Alteriqipengyuania lutimaris]|uniref:hypothetical protein n=1 Tax=Alteriqipengyuania lutimaris TaxID=1538146 RepID=UPI0015F158A5|nr:hypothetical protein [Alteriqipengyuania lutimaris]
MGRAKGQAAKRAAEQASHRRKVDGDYRARHPRRAAEESAFRKDRRQRRRAAADRDPHFDAGTPETAQKARSVQQGALARMFELGHVSADELAWSQEIRAVAEKLARDVTIGTFSLETRVDQSRSGQGASLEALGAVRAEIAYTSWRKDLSEAQLVLAMIVQDVSWRTAAGRFHVGPVRAKKLLLDALQAWPRHCREARENISEADLVAAQAGLF